MSVAMMREDIGYIFDEEILLRTDLAYFAEVMLDMEISDHHKTWSRLVAKHKKLCVEAPRDHGKSFMFSFAYAIWRAYYHWIPATLAGSEYKSIPRISVGYIFSNTQDQSVKLLELVKQEIESNPRLMHLMPKTKDVWNKTEIKLANGAWIRARGWGQAVRGAHPVWVICDDVLNDETIYSELTRNKQIDYFFSAVTPMLVPEGQLVVVGTPFHQEDLYQRLAENRAYFFHRSPAINDQTGEALWPTRYTKELLLKRKEEVGSTRFAREYLCLDGNTPILTYNHGYKPIKDILPGDIVLSHTGSWNRVLNRWENRRDARRMVCVKTSNGLGHIMTEDHELYVTKTDYRRDVELGKTEWVRAKDISTRPSERVYLKVPVPIVPYREMDESLAYLAGWYAAEGHVGAQQQVVLSLNRNVVMDRIQAAAIACFGKEFQPYNQREHCIQWTLNSKDAKEFFSRFGTNCYEKHVGEFLFADECAKRAFFDGYFSGDGYWNASGVEATSASFKLICGLSDMLASIGAACQIRKFQNKGRGAICGRDVSLSDCWEITVSGSNATVLDGISRRQSHSFIKDGFLYSRIKSIDIVEDYTDETVYDLHVERDHSYAGLHGMFHNCLPISDESSLFPERILTPCYDHSFEMPNMLTREDRRELRVFTGVDLAMSSTVGADYTVITTLGVDKFQNRWILDIKRKRGLSLMEQLRLIEDVNRNFKPLKVLIEDNAFQRIFADELIRNTDIPVEGFTTTAHNKNALDRGVPSLQILFENKKFVIPRKTERDRDLTDKLVNELKCFTWHEGKLQGLGAHDDCVMSLWIANECANSHAFSFSFVGE